MEESKKEFFFNRKIGFKPKLIAEQISQILADAILEGSLKGDQKLVEAELQNKFGTSKSPIREALRDLEKKGLVIINPRKGARVKKVTLKDIEDIFPVRSVLEGLAAKEAYEKISKENIADMEELFIKMKKAIKDNDLIKFRDYHFKFHEIFINASNNSLLIEFLKKIRQHILWYNFSYKYFQEDFDYPVQIHKEILDLFKNKNTNSSDIEDLVRRHINDGYKKFKDYLEMQGDNVAVYK